MYATRGAYRRRSACFGPLRGRRSPLSPYPAFAPTAAARRQSDGASVIRAAVRADDLVRDREVHSGALPTHGVHEPHPALAYDVVPLPEAVVPRQGRVREDGPAAPVERSEPAKLAVADGRERRDLHSRP